MGRIMANLHIRGVSEETIAAFKHQAEKTGKSLNETVRDSLDEAAATRKRLEALARAAEIRKATGPYTGQSIVEMLREDRDSR
jgi:plasmid stability protein